MDFENGDRNFVSIYRMMFLEGLTLLVPGSEGRTYANIAIHFLIFLMQFLEF